jgi:hypothetical protein
MLMSFYEKFINIFLIAVVTRHKEKIETLLEEERALSRHTKNGF